MRISDAMMSANYLTNLSKSREKLETIQSQMSSQKRIQNPSDDPAGTARVMNYQAKMSQTDLYQKNIDGSLTFIKNSVSALEQMDTSIADVLKSITDSRNGNLNGSNLADISDKIDSVISTLLGYSNTYYDGKYLFGGTDNSAAPFGFTSDNKAVEVKSSDITGYQNVRISENRIQNINVPGSDIFSTIVRQTGNLNSASAVGSSTLSTTQVYDATGNAYSLNVTYQKTAANTYNMTYDILDGGGSTVLSAPPAAQAFVFDSSSGLLKTVDGSAPGKISVKVASKKIEFLIDPSQVVESGSAASVSSTSNQKTNIFNTLISIRDSLKNGTTPTAQQESDVQNFFDNLVNKESQIGNVQSQLESVQELLKQKSTNFQELIAKDVEVDMPKLLIELQNQQYVLDMSYKMASMILPKSLMDFL